MDVEGLTAEEAADLESIRARKKVVVAAHRLKKGTGNNRPLVPAKHNAQRERTLSAMKERLGRLGIDAGAAVERVREQSRGRKRSRWVLFWGGGGAWGGGGEGEEQGQRLRERSRGWVWG